MNRKIKEIKNDADIHSLEQNTNIYAIVLFGSLNDKTYNEMSDIDICIIGQLSDKEKEDISRKLFNKYDLCFFDELPIYIQMRIFKGKFLYCKNTDIIYDLCFKVLKKHEEYSHLIKSRMMERYENV